MALRKITLRELRVTGARALRTDRYYPALSSRLLRDRYELRVEPKLDPNRALLLNLSFWSPGDGADVIASRSIAADVVAHIAWHHVARQALGAAGTTVDGMLLGESIASAFDVYLVGRLLVLDASCEFLRSQIPALSEVAASAGLSAKKFQALLGALARDPEAAFADLRQLLFEVATQLLRARGIDAANAVIESHRRDRFFSLLHHYNVSNWLLHSRAYGPKFSLQVDRRIAALDQAMRGADSELRYLARQWLEE